MSPLTGQPARAYAWSAFQIDMAGDQLTITTRPKHTPNDQQGAARCVKGRQSLNAATVVARVRDLPVVADRRDDSSSFCGACDRCDDDDRNNAVRRERACLLTECRAVASVATDWLAACLAKITTGRRALRARRLSGRKLSWEEVRVGETEADSLARVDQEAGHSVK